MFRFLSAFLIFALAGIHVGAAGSMTMDGKAPVVVVSNGDDSKQQNSADLKSITLNPDCCDEVHITNQSGASHCQISHCQIDCGLVGQQSANRALLQLRDNDFAPDSFTITNESEIPLRPPIA